MELRKHPKESDMEFDENENLDKDSDGMHADTELGHNSQAAEEKQL